MSNPLKHTNFRWSFKYEAGVPFLDGWRNVSDSRTGDCDDYAWTSLVIMEGGVWPAFKALWLCDAAILHVQSSANRRSGGLKKFFGSHAVLYRHGAYTDSSMRVPRDYLGHEMRWKQPIPWVAFRVLWGATLGRLFS